MYLIDQASPTPSLNNCGLLFSTCIVVAKNRHSWCVHAAAAVVVVVLQALIDIAADEGWLATTLRAMHLVQMCVQGSWISCPSILCLPHIRESHLSVLLESLMLAQRLGMKDVLSLPEFLTLYQLDEKHVTSLLTELTQSQQHARNVLPYM